MAIVRDRFNNIVAVEYNFTTMNNVNDNAFLDLSKGECSLLQNVDLLDDEGGVTRRKGYTATSITSAVHSGWSSKFSNLAFYVKGGYLCQFNGTTETQLLAIGNTRCCFVDVNESVVFSNGIVIGSVRDGVATLFPATQEEHKFSTPAGQCLEFYNGRLYVGVGTELFCSDPFVIGRIDERVCVVSVFDSKITMIRRTSNGLICATDKETFFLAGEDIQSGSVTITSVALYGAILGTDVFVNGENVKEGTPGEGALWCSTRGICFGGSGGAFKNITEAYYTYEYGTQGCGLLRFKDGQVHYLANIAKEQTAFNQNAQPQLDVDSVEY